MLGGSIGIAASSAISAVQQQSQLAGIVSPEQVGAHRSDGGAVAPLTETQAAAVRKAFSDAFTWNMRVCTVIAGLALFSTLGIYRRNRLTIGEMREKQIREERERRTASMRQPREL